MRSKWSALIAGACFSAWSFSSQAADIDFSLGAGYPFFVVPEFSMPASDGQQRWYLNYKLGISDGFAIGVEQSVSDNHNHALGMFIGAVGTENDECRRTNRADDDNVGESIGEAIGEAIGDTFGCALHKAFGDETTNGLGLSYSYNWRGLNQPGFRVRFEFGYGRGSDSDENRFNGGIGVSYQF